MAERKRPKPAAPKPPPALRSAVDELLGIERAQRALDDVFLEQKAEYKARTQELTRARAEVMAELRGEGRQVRLRFDAATGEVLGGASDA